MTTATKCVPGGAATPVCTSANNGERVVRVSLVNQAILSACVMSDAPLTDCSARRTVTTCGVDRCTRDDQLGYSDTMPRYYAHCDLVDKMEIF